MRHVKALVLGNHDTAEWITAAIAVMASDRGWEHGPIVVSRETRKEGAYWAVRSGLPDLLIISSNPFATESISGDEFTALTEKVRDEGLARVVVHLIHVVGRDARPQRYDEFYHRACYGETSLPEYEAAYLLPRWFHQCGYTLPESWRNHDELARRLASYSWEREHLRGKQQANRWDRRL